MSRTLLFMFGNAFQEDPSHQFLYIIYHILRYSGILWPSWKKKYVIHGVQGVTYKTCDYLKIFSCDFTFLLQRPCRKLIICNNKSVLPHFLSEFNFAFLGNWNNVVVKDLLINTLEWIINSWSNNALYCFLDFFAEFARKSTRSKSLLIKYM